MEPGDLITVVMANGSGTFTYSVTNTLIVEPSEYGKVIPTIDSSVATLTLATCHPEYTSKQRLVVQALLVPEQSDQVMAPPAPGDPNAMMWLVARQDVDYVGQLGFRREPYQVISAVTRLGTSSATFSAEVVDPLRGDAVLARGRTVLVSADPQGHPIPLPDHVRAALTPGLVTTA